MVTSFNRKRQTFCLRLSNNWDSFATSKMDNMASHTWLSHSNSTHSLWPNCCLKYLYHTRISAKSNDHLNSLIFHSRRSGFQECFIFLRIPQTFCNKSKKELWSWKLTDFRIHNLNYFSFWQYEKWRKSCTSICAFILFTYIFSIIWRCLVLYLSTSLVNTEGIQSPPY